MHSSSSLTLFFKYFFPIAFGTPLLSSLVNSELTSTELLILTVIVLTLSFLYARTFGKLRRVKALQNHLVTDTISYEETIPYDKIIYVYQIGLFKPIMIGIKYIDEETGKEKRFFTLASFSNQFFSFNFFGINEVELTQFIRRQARFANPSYSETNEPSRWAPAAYMFFGTLIIILLINLLMGRI